MEGLFVIYRRLTKFSIFQAFGLSSQLSHFMIRTNVRFREVIGCMKRRLIKQLSV